MGGYFSSITVAKTSLNAAWEIAKAIRAADTQIQTAELKLKLADMMSELADARVNLAEVQDELLENRKEIERLQDARKPRP